MVNENDYEWLIPTGNQLSISESLSLRDISSVFLEVAQRDEVEKTPNSFWNHNYVFMSKIIEYPLGPSNKIPGKLLHEFIENPIKVLTNVAEEVW